VLVRKVDVPDEQPVAVDRAMFRNSGNAFAGACQPFNLVIDRSGRTLIDGCRFFAAQARGRELVPLQIAACHPLSHCNTVRLLEEIVRTLEDIARK
jgi:hypothetical protein